MMYGIKKWEKHVNLTWASEGIKKNVNIEKRMTQTNEIYGNSMTVRHDASKLSR